MKSTLRHSEIEVIGDVPWGTILRHSGIEVVGDVPWGTHFCQFYETSQDLIGSLVPYFREGLKSNEFCIWVTSEPLRVDQAQAALQAAVPDLDQYIEKGQIEFFDYSQWYTRSGEFSANEALQSWLNKLNTALRRGYKGVRATGNIFWLEHANWADFIKYEETVNNIIGRYRMLAICTYSLRKCGPMEVLDVLCNHQFAIRTSQQHSEEILESWAKKPTHKIESNLQTVKDPRTLPPPDHSLNPKSPFHFILVSNPKLLLHFVLSDLNAGREPLLSDMAAKLGLSESDLAKSLSPLGIEAQDTTSDGKRSRYFTKSMIPQIEKIVGRK